MAQHEEIVLWLDRRWKNAIEKHLKGETLQEHLSDFFVRVQDGVGVVHFSRDGEWNIYGLSECFLRQNLPTFDAVFQPL